MSKHVVVDGSNLATEGRSQPSLRQLNEAVLAFIEEHPQALITVVVDATFGHRIDPKEVAEFDEAVNNNELVAPPAGAIGRGDAFVLSIAHKVNATILTNDSYQEFHAQYDWLFDEGRLIGGKPVPHIGWVFVPRLPVRGPMSRKVTSEAKRRGRKAADTGTDGTVRVGSVDANQPMPVPTAPPPGASLRGTTPAPAAAPAASEGGRGRGRRRGKGGGTAPEQAAVEQAATTASPSAAEVAAAAARGPKGNTVNELLPFLSFVEHHPAGTSVNATVDHYSSHGAYVTVGEVMGYVPLRLMADPAPRSAREFMKIGESITLVVEAFVPEKRSIDLAVPGMGTAQPPEPPKAKPARGAKAKAAAVAAAAEAAAAPVDATPTDEVAAAPAKRGSRRGSSRAAAAPAVEAAPSVDAAATVEAPARPSRRSSKKAAPAAAVVEVVATPTPSPAADTPVGKPARAKKAATSAPAPVSAPAAQPAAPVAKKAPAKKAAAKAAAKAVAAPAEEAPGKKAPAKKAATKKAPAKKAAAAGGGAG